ncbi:MAG: hypothetical protein LBK13_01750 [Spirochaetales bacterium]|nr:hypothetical protein [Spirochaetales bacterium]
MGGDNDGFTFHSCGNWSKISETINGLQCLKVVDEAFTSILTPIQQLPSAYLFSARESVSTSGWQIFPKRL